MEREVAVIGAEGLDSSEVVRELTIRTDLRVEVESCDPSWPRAGQRLHDLVVQKPSWFGSKTPMVPRSWDLQSGETQTTCAPRLPKNVAAASYSALSHRSYSGDPIVFSLSHCGRRLGGVSSTSESPVSGSY
jgi:hypothetical protein